MLKQLKGVKKWLKRKTRQLKVSNYTVELALIAVVILELIYNIRWLVWGFETEYIVDIQFVLIPFAAANTKYFYQNEYFKPLTMYGMYTLGKQLLINYHVIKADVINFTDILVTLFCLFYIVYMITPRLINVKKR